MVADDVAQAGAFHLAAHVGQVGKALVALRKGGVFEHGQHGMEFHRDEGGVFHLALGGAGMDAQALDLHDGGAGVEVFIVDAAQRAAVQGIGEIRAKALHVEVVHAAAHLLVRGEGDLDGPWGKGLATASRQRP